MDIKELNPGFVAEISDIDLADPASDAHFPDIQAAMDQYGALVFHGTPMSQERQIEWASQFGTLEGKGQNVNIVMQGKMRISQQLADISNVDASDKLMGQQDRRRMFSLGNQLWKDRSGGHRRGAGVRRHL